MEPFGDGLRDHGFGAGKALGVCKLLAIVDDVDTESRVDREPARCQPTWPAPMMKRRGVGSSGSMWTSICPPHTEPVLLGEIVVQLVVEQGRSAAGQRLARFPERVVLVTAPPMVPIVRPSGNTSILAPARCGVDPFDRTTVTSATGSPRRSASAAAARTSSLRPAPRSWRASSPR